MNVAIIVFSPSGNTLKVSKMLEKSLLGKEMKVQIIDITRNKEIFRERKISQFLEQNVKKHDLICIGSPVYAHHLHYNVKDLIKALPSPENGWGQLAIPFVTYGGINSGVALQEAGKLLKKSDRIPVAGMKINSQHCLSKLKHITTKINEGLPGEEVHHLIDELAKKILSLVENKDDGNLDISQKLCYQNWKTRIKAKLIFREKIWQKHLYPKFFGVWGINHEKCINCGRCSKVCPVQRIEMTKDGPMIPKGSPACIHCGSCVSHCSYDAITFDVNWERWSRLLKEAAEGHGPLPSNEEPKSEVYC